LEEKLELMKQPKFQDKGHPVVQAPPTEYIFNPRKKQASIGIELMVIEMQNSINEVRIKAKPFFPIDRYRIDWILNF
jgi:hypothetical protein